MTPATMSPSRPLNSPSTWSSAMSRSRWLMTCFAANAPTRLKSLGESSASPIFTPSSSNSGTKIATWPLLRSSSTRAGGDAVLVLELAGVLQVRRQDGLFDDCNQFIEGNFAFALHEPQHAQIDVHRVPPLFISHCLVGRAHRSLPLRYPSAAGSRFRIRLPSRYRPPPAARPDARGRSTTRTPSVRAGLPDRLETRLAMSGAGRRRPTTQARRESTSSGRQLVALPGAPVPQLDDPVGDALADDHDERHADQLGVAELHAGRHLEPVVEQHVVAGRLQLRDELLRRLVDRPAPSSRRPRARRTG